MSFSLFHFLHLIPLAIVGLYCSYTDLKYSRIKNKWIKYSLVYILFLYSGLYLYNNFYLGQPQNISYLLRAVSNGLVGIVIGYLLWHFGFWSAGDGKLFFVYTLFIPLDFYSKSYLELFPSFNLLINLFFPLLIVLSGFALFTALKSIYLADWDEFRDWVGELTLEKFKSAAYRIFEMYFTYLFIFSSFRVVSGFVDAITVSQIFSNPFLILAVVILLRILIMSLREKYSFLVVLIYGLPSGLISYFLYLGRFSTVFRMLKLAVIVMLLIGGVKRVLDYYIRKKEINRVTPPELEEGIVLSKNARNQVKLQAKKESRLDEIGKLEGGGLTLKQVKLIQELFHQDNENIELGTYTTFPFAPFLVLAAVICIVTRSSFVVLLDQLLSLAS